MQTVPDMSKDQTFKLRLAAEDRRRLDDLAAHYSAPAATVMRILIKERHAQLPPPPRASMVEELRDEHKLLLSVLKDWSESHVGRPIPRVDLDEQGFALALNVSLPRYPNASFRGGNARILNDLVRWGYLQRVKGPKGSALVLLPKALAP